MPPTALGERWGRADDVVWRRLPDGVLLFPSGSPEPFAVTGPGSTLWDLLAERPRHDELIAELARRYHTDADTVATDLASVFSVLRSTGAVTVSPS